MKAKVKEECRYSTVTSCAGIVFYKFDWSVVPPEREEEALKNKLLEIQGNEIDATNSAQELAKENGIDLSEIQGTGKDGRILLSDIKEVLDD
ncbi:MAG: E3 binding domain-containing protein [Euryarchaeota archaeon]|nr:E3 binding domain-containing protein [Euryarchaeota archaeon]